MSSQGEGIGGAEPRPGRVRVRVHVCMFTCIYVIYMGAMYTESTGALRDGSRDRIGEKTPRTPEGAGAAWGEGPHQGVC